MTVSRVKHIAYVVNDLQESADFFERIFGFRRYSEIRKPGTYPGQAVDITDGELNITLLCPNPNVERRAWVHGTAGPNHLGIESEDAPNIYKRVRAAGIETYSEEKAAEPRFFKFRDPNGVEVDVSVPERGWPLPGHGNQ